MDGAICLQALRDAAGDTYWQRGEKVYASGAVGLLEVSADRAVAEVHGTSIYEVVVAGDASGGLHYDCACPLGVQGAACKHVVATALCWAEHDAESAPGKSPVAAPPPPDNPLKPFLARQNKAQLTDWLLRFAADLPDVNRRLTFLMEASTADSAKALRSSLSTLIGRPRHMDWHDSQIYAGSLDTLIDFLEMLAGSDPARCADACAYCMQRLLKVYARSDDSHGAIGDQLRRLAVLYPTACERAELGGKALARTLLKLEPLDDWGYFELDTFWDALGEAGQSHYCRHWLSKFEALPDTQTGVGGPNYDYTRMHLARETTRRVEAIARVSHDLELLIRALSRDLSHPRAYLPIIDALRAAGRDREAEQWAERGHQAFPDSTELRTALAVQRRAAGFDEEALDLLWRNVVDAPHPASWHALKQAAGDDWPTWKARCLDAAAGRDGQDPARKADVAKAAKAADVHCSHRVELLMVCDDMEAAMELANTLPCAPHTLQALAAAVAPDWPEHAGRFLRRLVDQGLVSANAQTYGKWVQMLSRAATLLPRDETDAWVRSIRKQYGHRPKLMGLIDAADP